MFTKKIFNFQNFLFMLTKNSLSFILIFSFFLFGCSKEQNSIVDKKEKTLAQTPTTSADYFRAVFFLDGPLMNKLPEYQQQSINKIIADQPDLIKNIRNVQNDIINYIRQKDESFFDNFKAKITSGNYDQVNNAVDNAIPVLSDALKNLQNSPTAVVDINNARKSYKNLSSASKNSLIANMQAALKSRNGFRNSNSDAEAGRWLATTETVSAYVYTVVVVIAGGFIAIAVVLAAPDEPGGTIDATGILQSNKDSYAFQEYMSTITSNLASVR